MSIADAAQKTYSLASNASIAEALQTFDNALAVTNPFIFDTSGIQDNVFGVKFTDPVLWLQTFGSNLVGDLVALLLRIIFIALGIFLLYRVLDHYVNFSGNIQGASNNVGSLLKSIGPMLAA